MDGWLALRWQTERESRRVAEAIFAELSVTQDMLESDKVGR
jgi:hypothetical protein